MKPVTFLCAILLMAAFGHFANKAIANAAATALQFEAAHG